MKPCAMTLAGFLIAAGLAAPAHAADVRGVIADAQTSARAGGPASDADLARLVEALRASREADEQRRLIAAIGALGDAGGDSPASVKAYLRANAPAALLDVARSPAEWSVRGDALLCLRAVDASDEALSQAIALAEADASPQQGFIRSRGQILRRWQESRGPGESAAGVAEPADPAAEQQALLLLRAHRMGVSYDSLTRAVGEADPGVVAALLDAGVKVGPADAARAAQSVVSGLATACQAKPVRSEAIGRTLEALAGRGFPVGFADGLGNTILLSAAQFCPAPVADRLLALGAPADPVNKQGFTPLKMALVSGEWDVVEVLVDHGARVTAKESGQLFFEPPQDPGQRALLARATR